MATLPNPRLPQFDLSDQGSYAGLLETDPYARLLYQAQKLSQPSAPGTYGREYGMGTAMDRILDAFAVGGAQASAPAQGFGAHFVSGLARGFGYGRLTPLNEATERRQAADRTNLELSRAARLLALQRTAKKLEPPSVEDVLTTDLPPAGEARITELARRRARVYPSDEGTFIDRTAKELYPNLTGPELAHAKLRMYQQLHPPPMTIPVQGPSGKTYNVSPARALSEETKPTPDQEAMARKDPKELVKLFDQAQSETDFGVANNISLSPQLFMDPRVQQAKRSAKLRLGIGKQAKPSKASTIGGPSAKDRALTAAKSGNEAQFRMLIQDDKALRADPEIIKAAQELRARRAR